MRHSNPRSGPGIQPSLAQEATDVRTPLVLLSTLYGAYYLCRLNFSVAIPYVTRVYGFSHEQAGICLSAFLGLYATGQCIHGFVGDIVRPWRLVIGGLTFSAIVTLLTPFSDSRLYLWILLWGCNGYVQSMGWAPTVRMARVGTASHGSTGGYLSTSYIFGSAAAFAIAGLFGEAWGWRAIFIGPALLTFVIAIAGHWHFSQVQRRTGVVPERMGSGPTPPTIDLPRTSKLVTLVSVAARPQVLTLGFGLSLLNFVRYGFLLWLPTYFTSASAGSVSIAAFKSIVLPLAGGIGAIAIGWSVDRLRYGIWQIVGPGTLILLALSCTVGIFLQNAASLTQIGLLCVIGFFIYGSHSLYVAVYPMILGGTRRISLIAGTIDGIGYVGALLSGWLIGLLLDRTNWGYVLVAFVVASVLSSIASLVSLTLLACKTGTCAIDNS